MIFDLAISTGYRLDDILHMRTWQLRGDELRVKERKTGHVRQARIPDDLRDALTSWIGRRHPLSYAFTSYHVDASKVHRSTFWRHFIAAAIAAGYKNLGYTPHSLRKVYAVRLRKAGYSLAEIQRDLGHSHLSTTLIYAFSDLVTGLDSDVCDRIRTDATASAPEVAPRVAAAGGMRRR